MKAVADTHVLVFYLFTPDRLTETALDSLLEAENTDGVVVSAATFADLWYASQKTSSPAVAPGVSEQIQATVLDPTTNLILQPISAATMTHFGTVPLADLRPVRPVHHRQWNGKGHSHRSATCCTHLDRGLPSLQSQPGSALRPGPRCFASAATTRRTGLLSYQLVRCGACVKWSGFESGKRDPQTCVGAAVAGSRTEQAPAEQAYELIPHAEQVQFTKQVVPVERVRILKRVVTSRVGRHTCSSGSVGLWPRRWPHWSAASG